MPAASMRSIVDSGFASLPFTRGAIENGLSASKPSSTIVAQRGKPQTIDSDHAGEFISQVMDQWAYERGVKQEYSPPGKRTFNAMVESFQERLRQERLGGPKSKKFLTYEWYKNGGRVKVGDFVERIELRQCRVPWRVIPGLALCPLRRKAAAWERAPSPLVGGASSQAIKLGMYSLKWVSIRDSNRCWSDSPTAVKVLFWIGAVTITVR